MYTPCVYTPCVYIKNMSTPVVCSHSNLGWLYYGILKTDMTLEVVNAIGALLQILYIIVYFKYTDNKVGFCTGLVDVFIQ